MTITATRPAATRPTPEALAPGGYQQASDHSPIGALTDHVAGSDSRPADLVATPEARSLGGTIQNPDTGHTASRPANAAATPITGPPGGSKLRQAAAGSMPIEAPPVGSTSTPGQPAILAATPMPVPLADPALEMAAAVLDDLERVKNANANRLRQLTRSVEDSDGEMRGFGLDDSHPDVARLAAMVDSLVKLEHDAELNLKRALRKHPLHGWVKSMRGVGEKQAARLLAVIGDPYIRPAITKADGTEVPEGPRTVSALWAYCGYHVLPGQNPSDAQRRGAGDGGDLGRTTCDVLDGIAGVAPKRRRGERANWSTVAKTRAYLIAESCIKQLDAHCRTGQGAGDAQRTLAGAAVRHHEDCTCSPYRVTYDARRTHTRLSRPEWTDGHSHADAMRVASKAILRDLWRAARDLHEGSAA